MCLKCRSFNPIWKQSKKEAEKYILGNEYKTIRESKVTLCFDGCCKLADHFQKLGLWEESLLWHEKSVGSKKMMVGDRIEKLSMMTIMAHQHLDCVTRAFNYGQRTIEYIFQKDIDAVESYQTSFSMDKRQKFFTVLAESSAFFKRYDISAKAYREILRIFDQNRTTKQQYFDFFELYIGNLTRSENYKMAREETMSWKKARLPIAVKDILYYNVVKSEKYLEKFMEFAPQNKAFVTNREDLQYDFVDVIRDAKLCHWYGMIYFFPRDGENYYYGEQSLDYFIVDEEKPVLSKEGMEYLSNKAPPNYREEAQIRWYNGAIATTRRGKYDIVKSVNMVWDRIMKEVVQGHVRHEKYPYLAEQKFLAAVLRFPTIPEDLIHFLEVMENKTIDYLNDCRRMIFLPPLKHGMVNLRWTRRFKNAMFIALHFQRAQLAV